MKKIIMFLLVFFVPVGAQAIEYGSNLIPDDQGGFEDIIDVNSGWSISPTSIAQISSVYANTGTHSLEFDPTAGTQYPTCNHHVQTVGNRSHVVKVYIREPEGAVGGRYIILDGVQASLDTGHTDNFSLQSAIIEVSGSGIVNSLIILKMYARSDIWERNLYYDDVSVVREKVSPSVGGDSENGILTVGATRTISLYASQMPKLDYKIAFDPDITVQATNATVGTLTWVRDNEVTVELTPVSTGAVELALENVYSEMQTNYSMTAIEPVQCGDLGTKYQIADIVGPNGAARDCYVNLNDFALLAEQWLVGVSEN